MGVCVCVCLTGVLATSYSGGTINSLLRRDGIMTTSVLTCPISHKLIKTVVNSLCL